MSSKLFKHKLVDPAFCIITPTSYLEKYAVQSSTHLVLAHLVATDEAYADFYLSRSKAGDRIIMDNSAFELGESFTPDLLINLAKRVGAHAVVLPDYPFQPADKTIQAAIKYIPLFKGEGVDIFFVPQSSVGELDDWIAGYKWAVNEPDIDIIGYSILGIPNALPDVPVQYARVVMAHILRERGLLNHTKHNHFLGLNAAPNVEIPALLSMGVLDTCDSSGPVWAGINGIQYNVTQSDWMGMDKKYLRHVDFNETASLSKPHIQDIVQYNLDLTLNLFKSPVK